MNRWPYASGYTLDQGLSGATLSRTLGYLLSFLLIAMLSAVALSGLPWWLGFGGAILGTVMVNRAAMRGTGAYAWGAVVAIGMGMMAGPLALAVAATQPQTLVLSGLGLVLAFAVAAAVVAWVPWDFSRIWPLLTVGLIALLVVGLLSMLLPGLAGMALSPTYSILGVLLFTGYLMVDLSLLRYRGLVLPGDGAAVVLAVRLLVDIINLFLFLITLGTRRS
jgi:FtsH-binding integral membrane protein